MGSQPALNIYRFDGIDLVPEAFPSWQLETVQLDPGNTVSLANSLSFADLKVMACYETHSSLNHLRLPAGWTLFTICLDRTPQVKLNGVDLPNNRIAVITSTRDHAAVIPAGFSSVQIEISNALLDRSEMLEDQIFQSTDTDLQLHLPLGVSGRLFSAWLWRTLLDVEFMNLIRAEESQAALFRENVLSGLFEALAETSRPSKSLGVRLHKSRYRTARMGLEEIVSNSDYPLSAHQVAENVGVSDRELRYAFRTIYSVSPYQYILKWRLHEARKTLRRSSPHGTKVTTVATDIGFAHLGRFSCFYRELFGECPSETLARQETS